MGDNSKVLEIRILHDIALTDMCTNEVVIITKVTESNYKEMVLYDTTNFYKAVCSYQCDVCRFRCNEDNSIFTNGRYRGVDVCSKCIQRTLLTVQPEGDFIDYNVFSLKKIYAENRERISEERDKENEEQEELFKRLRETGHKCVSMIHSNPGYVMWCKTEPCAYLHEDNIKSTATLTLTPTTISKEEEEEISNFFGSSDMKSYTGSYKSFPDND